MKSDMKRMSRKLMELEKECCVMKQEIEKDCSRRVVKKEKVSLWKELKRQFGCLSVTNCSCPGNKKKLHP